LRRESLSQGRTLTETSRVLAQRFGVPSDVLPMCDEPAPTQVLTDQGEMAFQEYFVKLRCAPVVRGFRYGAAGAARLSDEVTSALDDPGLEGVILCPSNPYLSVAPILAVPGLRERLAGAQVPVIAVSPIIGGAAVKGPAAKIMRELDLPVSPLEIAREYGDFLDLMLIDDADRALVGLRRAQDPAIDTTAILMRTPEDRMRLAAECLERLI
jgi:LPPG:FO 2-phospho-L-lactate transferase